VLEGVPHESFPPSQDALPGVKGTTALGGVGLTREKHGLLDEESACNDEDEPDD